MNHSRESASPVDNDIIEIIPMEEYDANKAKLHCSVSWILDKAYRDQIPKEFIDPFYETQDGLEHIKPQLANLMVSSEIYCQACSNMFGDTSLQWQGRSGHWSIIQVLSRKGIYVTDQNDTAVTEAILIKMTPFQTSAHIALIDALMTAYIREVVTIERVVQAVRRFATFNASSELPSCSEDALLFWVNKVCVTVQHRITKEDQVLQGQTSQKVRIVSRTGVKDSVSIPLIDDLLQDVSDGCSLAVLISFYCPTVISFKDICLKSNVGIADSLYNLRLVRTFCDDNLPGKTFHLTYEDFLYTHNNLKKNLDTFLAELFYWFEIQRVECVQSEANSRPTTAKKLSSNCIPQVPEISNVTKQSFHKSSADDMTLPRSVTHMPPRQPLLYKRQQLEHSAETEGPKSTGRPCRRSQSLNSGRDRDIIHQSVLAWQEKNEKSAENDGNRKSEGSTLLGNVSMDSELMESFTDDQLGSMDFDLSDSTPPPPIPAHLETSRELQSNLQDPRHPDYMEVQSVTSGATTTRTVHPDEKDLNSHPKQTHEDLLSEFSAQLNPTSDNKTNNNGNIEPLMPARLKPRKEIINNHSKEQERDDRLSSMSPKLSESSESEVVTPLPEDQLSENEMSVRSHSQLRYTAFTVNTDVSQDVQSHRSQLSTARSSTDSVKLSYTVSDQATPEAARAAGIPVVGDSGEQSWRRCGSREGSVASSRSSGDCSDHESRKIHRDQKGSETKEKKAVSPPKTLAKFGSKSNTTVFQKPKMVVRTASESQKKDTKMFTTNFAEIKKMKSLLGNVDNSGSVYMQHGHEVQGNGHQKSSHTEKKPDIKNTNKALTTTWQQTKSNTRSPEEQESSGSSENGDTSQPVMSELMQIRLKLEEKRKMIERKKNRMEIQQQKQRQRMGKTAFLNVVTKHHEEDDKDSSASEENVPQTSNDTEVDRVQPSATSQPSTRAFSREGIQQTIENVRKKWFPGDEEPQNEIKEEKNTEARKTSPPKEEKSVTNKTVSSDDRISNQLLSKIVDKEGESSQVSRAYKETDTLYSRKLDKLDHDLSDLKGEIMRMSLEQEHMHGLSDPSTPQTGSKADIIASDHKQKVVQNPPTANFSHTSGMDIHTPERPFHNVTMTSSMGPQATHIRSGHVDVPTPERVLMGTTPYPPQPQPFQQSMQPQPGLHQSGLPMYPDGNQYSPVTCVPFTAGYHTHVTQPFPQPRFPPTHPQGYQQSPPYSLAPHLMSPQSQYGMPTVYNVLPQQFPAHSHMSTTHTVPSHPPVSHMTPPNHVGAQVFHAQVTDKSPASVWSMSHSTPTAGSDTQPNEISAGLTVSPPETEIHPKNEVTPHKQTQKVLTDADQRSSTPETSSQSETVSQKIPQSDLSSIQQTPTQAPPLKHHSPQPDLSSQNQLDISSQEGTPQLADQSHIGFVIGDPSQSMEEELNRKKEKFIQMQNKRKEEQDKKRQYKEMEMARRREQERLRQEEAEKRKANEKARREEIFRQYQDKKHREDEELTPPVRRNKSRSRDKPRPKSMFVKGNSDSESVEGLHSVSSTEDLSSQAFTVSPGHTGPSGVGSRKPPSLAPRLGNMRKAVSCNTLSHSTEGKLTYRRPPSPDLARLRGRGRGSTESSESGSDYAGPKLFVKPSSKSNRHIIINAVSQCVLAGPVNAEQKNKVLEVLAKSDAKHFLILFRDHSCQFRGLYNFDPDAEESFKIHGIGPKQLTSKMIERFYKYNSGGKSFSEVTSTKHLSVSIDAVVIFNALWKTSKAAPKR